MHYIESPERYKPKESDISLFLAGGITGCPDWQHEMVDLLKNTDIVLLNPRRANFPINDPNAAPAQVKWEFDHLRKASAILFWFPKETLCPIVLYELGAWSMTFKHLFIGVDSGYQRELDVRLQTAFARPDIEIQTTLQTLSEAVSVWIDKAKAVKA